ncbi:Na(+)-translocating NADH-quinone reductase subunit B [Symmachiella dynata]|uniref:NADH:ubiquinone reductase (Na(+)-transporting) subunit B n=1 Tax=Symmachiella dynata TaxID=2527995 RepID=UPI00118AD44E|nr:NADH:ubiquinone reductase (Na(+)-transporting) subunit B [Symmachiella dynata]QDT46724.1 Na(+)-translocating NADH-quinone reductase subunit B [Symmachiella dynata]
MKPLRRFLDHLHPLFDKGGKFEKWFPLYEAADTFLYTPGEVTHGRTHVRDGMDLKRMLGTVAFALVPCMLMAMYNTGYQANAYMMQQGIESTTGWRGSVIDALGVGYHPDNIIADFVHGALYFLPVLIVCFAVGGFWEMLFATVRKHEINEGFLVTGILFPLTLPPTIPLWQVAVGITFAVIFAKEVFGGTGKNFLNPALAARAFLYFAYATDMTGSTIWTAVDGFSGATPLGLVQTDGMQALNVSWSSAFLGTMQGSMGETSVLCCLIGAAILVATGVGSWRIMLSVLVSSLVFSTLLWAFAGEDPTNKMLTMPPHWHLVVGGLAFGLVFMATDPVSASMTETGKYIYGALIGFMTILIRVLNPAFPEGIMLAILFGNVFAPLIDFCVVQLTIKRRALRHAA